jgi:hypothetical protein
MPGFGRALHTQALGRKFPHLKDPETRQQCFVCVAVAFREALGAELRRTLQVCFRSKAERKRLCTFRPWQKKLNPPERKWNFLLLC